MFKGLFRLSMLFVTGKFLKSRIKGLLLVLGFWLLLWFLQSEYLNYVDYSGDSRYIMYVSIAKVVLILCSLAAYILMVERPLAKSRALKAAASAAPVTLSSSNASDSPAQQLISLESRFDDGFEFLRHKKTLKSHTDHILKKK